jgi:hypothetical protein
LIARVIDQTERRVFAGEAVPAGEKLVSLFETHTDIIVKGGRDIHYARETAYPVDKHAGSRVHAPHQAHRRRFAHRPGI